MKKKITWTEDIARMRQSRSYSKIFNTIWSMALLLTVFIAGCKKDTYKGAIQGVCPTVVSTDPLDQAVNVVLDKVISVTFDTAMRASSINNATFTIMQGSTNIAGTVAPSANNAVFTFTPTVALLPSTTYTGTITTSAKDNLGSSLVSNYVWTFTTVPQGKFALTLSSLPVAGGTTTGSGLYNAGSSVTVTASPKSGYAFVNWTNGAVIMSTSTSYPFILTSSRALVANFKLISASQFSVALSSNPTAGGTTSGSGAYNKGSSVTVTATPNSGFTFTNWTNKGVIASTNPAYTFPLTANITLVAHFAPVKSKPLFTSVFAAFGGSAGVTNQGINTVINGAIATTAVATAVTGFHDGLTADVYTETPLNVGLVTGGIDAAPPFPGTTTKFAVATNALAAATAFYISISPANTPGGIDPGAGELGGLTLAPGVYKSASGTFNISNSDLTLDAKGDPNATWIFQTAAGLTVGIAGPAGARSVKLVNGAQAKNVYWYVGSSATINGAGGGIMVGTIIATSGVSLSTAGNNVQTVLNGRAISLVASVTMVNTTINMP